MVYVRHRHRLVRESVFDDIHNTMIACRWMSGTTSHEVTNPDTDVFEVVTTDPSDVFPLLDGHEVSLVDYFPESSSGSPATAAVVLNTMAVAGGEIGDKSDMELGNRFAHYQPYKFGMALYASSDAVAHAIFGDLNDRYRGALVNSDNIALYDADGDFVVDMEVSSFTYYRDVEVLAEENLYFGILNIVDLVEN